MASRSSRNVALRDNNRPGSARRATEKDPLKGKDPPATSSIKDDFSALTNALDAIEMIQKVDVNELRRLPILLQSLVTPGTRCAENVEWEKKYKDLKEKYEKIEKDIEEKSELEDKLENVTAQLKKTEQISLEQKKEIRLLQQHVESRDENINILKEKLNECNKELDSKEKRLQTHEKAMDEVKQARDDALSRLSRYMGQKMSEGNPNITDLSDQNRPSKLGEMYSELYDNEWTDAFEVLTETFHLTEKIAIERLLKILWESSNYTSHVSQSTMKTIEDILSGSPKGATPDCKRLLKEARKHVDIKKADGLLQKFREKLTSFIERTHMREDKVAIYIEKCFQLCWLMSIQDPPVMLSRDPERGSQFDTNRYRHYTHSGDNIDYVVWPALLLHKDGPILAKGVAEPYTKPRTQSAPAMGRLGATKDIPLGKTNQIQGNRKVREPTSGSVRMDMTLYGNDAPISSKSGHSPIVKQTYSNRTSIRVHSVTSTTPGQNSVAMQLYQHGDFIDDYDYSRFQRFRQDIQNFREPSMRRIYERDYDRYMSYLNTILGM